MQDFSQFSNKKTRIIVKVPNYVGDLIMLMPAMIMLRQGLPREQGYEIHVLTNERLADLLYGQDWVDRVIALPNATHADPGHPLREIARRLLNWLVNYDAIKYLRTLENYDISILLTRQVRLARIFKRLHVPTRMGVDFLGAGLWLTQPLPRPSILGDQRRFYREVVTQVLKKLSRKVDVAPVEPRIQVKEVWRTEAAELLKACWDKGFYVIVPGSARSRHGLLKRWPLESFIKVTERLYSTLPGVTPVFLFGPDELDLLDRAKHLIGKKEREAVIVGPDVARLGHVVAIVEKSAFVLTTDTGPRHIAASLKKEKELISIFGPTNINRATYRSEEYPIWINVGCNIRDCKATKCQVHRVCLTAITPEFVVNTIRTAIEAK